MQIRSFASFTLLLAAGLAPMGAAHAVAQFAFGPVNAASAEQQGPVDQDFPLPVQIRLQDCRSGSCVGAGPGSAFGTLSIEAPASGASATATPAGPFPDSARTAQGNYPAVTLRANGQFGTYRVDFVLRDAQGAVLTSSPVTLKNLNGSVGSPVQLSLLSGSGQSAGVRRRFADSIAFVVVDANGNTVPGVQVTARTPGDPNQASAELRPSGPGGSPTDPFNVVATTNFAGEARFDASANGRAGTYPVTASATGIVATPAASLTNTGVAGVFTDMVLLSGDGQSAAPTTPFAQPLAVRTLDAFGNPVANRPVTFAAPSAGTASAILNFVGNQVVVNSNASGNAQVSAIANALPGSYIVQITATLPTEVTGGNFVLSLRPQLSNTEPTIFANGFEPAPTAVVVDAAE
jgi:hypothetical protein